MRHALTTFLRWLLPWPFKGETLKEFCVRRCREEG